MEPFSSLLAICVGNSPVTGECPTQRPVTRGFDVSLIWTWINGWVNSGEAGDLRRHRPHCDATLMSKTKACQYFMGHPVCNMIVRYIVIIMSMA